MKRRPTLEMHGYCGTATYLVWRNMRRRCYNPKNIGFKNYGARGITVCDEWKNSFLAFLRDMGEVPVEGMQIDRIDNNKGYFKENCRWVTRLENMRNRRTSKTYEYNGVNLPLIEWSRMYGIAYDILRSRIERNLWSMEKALTTPVGHPVKFSKDYQPKKGEYRR